MDLEIERYNSVDRNSKYLSEIENRLKLINEENNKKELLIVRLNEELKNCKETKIDYIQITDKENNLKELKEKNSLIQTEVKNNLYNYISSTN